MHSNSWYSVQKKPRYRDRGVSGTLTRDGIVRRDSRRRDAVQAHWTPEYRAWLARHSGQ